MISIIIAVWAYSNSKSLLSESLFSEREKRENPRSLLFLHCCFLCTDPWSSSLSIALSLCGGSSLAGPILTQRALQTQSDKYLLKSFSSKIHGKPWSGCRERAGGCRGREETDRKAENKREKGRQRGGGGQVAWDVVWQWDRRLKWVKRYCEIMWMDKTKTD